MCLSLVYATVDFNTSPKQYHPMFAGDTDTPRHLLDVSDGDGSRTLFGTSMMCRVSMCLSCNYVLEPF